MKKISNIRAELRGGKFVRYANNNRKYMVSYNTKGNYSNPDNKHIIFRLPKLLWGWL